MAGWTWFFAHRRGVIMDYKKSAARGRVTVYRHAVTPFTAPKSAIYQHIVGTYKLGVLENRALRNVIRPGGENMAKVGHSVRKAIDDWELGEREFAMLHACNAVDGTASKLHPKLGSDARFTKMLRDNYAIFGPMAAPGVDLVNTRWPVEVSRPKASGGRPDIADVIYGIHRCAHGHGDALPDGFAPVTRCSRTGSQNQNVCPCRFRSPCG
jgi:hypothetical protein